MQGFSHVGLYVTNMERSLEFYTKLLGLKVLQRFPDSGTGKDIAFLGVNEPSLELLCPTIPEAKPRETKGCYDHLAWYVTDIAQAMQELSERGIKFSTPEPMIVLDGRKIAFFRGPDDKRIELVQLP